MAAAPLSNGLIVPYITLAHRGRTRPIWRHVDPVRFHAALWRRLCQICGQDLDERVALYIRPIDYLRGVAPEPGLHLECGRYVKQACPMLSGNTDRYNPTYKTHYALCTDDRCNCKAWAPHIRDPRESTRENAPAEAWYEAVIDRADYRVVEDPGNDTLPPVTGINLRDVHLLRVRRIRTAAPTNNEPGPVDPLALLIASRELFKSW
ncbi:hypothetical protein [Nocardia carnea]|uniref:hypothetical protein n=1 Tax=Nocardia carnea TaxID=37328 RepID=UPI002457392F|nr:hypothetical protein [Nocardia carnea]